MAHQQQFFRAAEQHQEPALVLLNAGVYRSAVYLAGIAAECAVKALILRYVPPKRQQDFVDDRFRGSKAHNFDHLRCMMEEQGCAFPSSLAPRWRELTGWTIDMRYEVARVSPAYAEQFIDTTEFTISFIRERLR